MYISTSELFCCLGRESHPFGHHDSGHFKIHLGLFHLRGASLPSTLGEAGVEIVVSHGVGYSLELITGNLQ